jgi:hypothetical protein
MHPNISELRSHFKNLIIDNSQAFYDKPFTGTPTFYSPRKFFGLPDGGLVFNADEISENSYNQDISGDRISHLITRLELGAETGYPQFKHNDASLINQPILRMSKLTYKLMRGIDYEKSKKDRIANFNFLHEKLKKQNELSYLIENRQFFCPMVYPFFCKNCDPIRKRLLDNKIFTATYWPNLACIVEENDFENVLIKNMIPIPIDSRNSVDDNDLIINLILQL